MSGVEIQVVGITSVPKTITFMSEWKRNLLLFDKLGNPNPEIMKRLIDPSVKHPHYVRIRKEVEYLLKNGLLIETSPLFLGEELIANPGLFPKEESAYLKEIGDQQAIFSDINSRIFANLCNHSSRWTGHQFVPISLRTDEKLPSTLKGINKEVVNIIIERMPSIHSQTPIEHILEFKAHKENRGNLIRLRNWMNKMNRDNYSEIEIKQEIEELLESYKENLRRHKMRYIEVSQEFVVTSGIEYLIHRTLPVMSVAKGLYSIYKKYKMLLPSEGKGNEIAYIYNSNRDFNPK